MKFNARVEVKWDHGALNKIVREAAENVMAERAREASALKCKVHGETATITPTRIGSGQRHAEGRRIPEGRRISEGQRMRNAFGGTAMRDAFDAQEFAITACCDEHRDCVARFLVGE